MLVQFTAGTSVMGNAESCTHAAHLRVRGEQAFPGASIRHFRTELQPYPVGETAD